MLDQRRAKQKGYITLREAADICNYSSDYIGQLIRSGKIKGEQVYSNVAWVTTEDEILSYILNKEAAVAKETHLSLALPSENLFKAARVLLYGVITIFVCLLLGLQYIFYVALDNQLTNQVHTDGVVTELAK